MSDPVLRRTTVPRLHATAPCASHLPGFLMERCALPMTPAQVNGPQDTLERAIMDAQLWDANSAPVEFEAFDADQDVISVIVEGGESALVLDVKDGRDGVQILANGRPMARVASNGQSFSMSNIRVLQSRANLL